MVMSVSAKLVLYFYGFPVSRESEHGRTDGRTDRWTDEVQRLMFYCFIFFQQQTPKKSMAHVRFELHTFEKSNGSTSFPGVESVEEISQVTINQF